MREKRMQDWMDMDWPGTWDDLKQHAVSSWEGLTEDDVDVREGDLEELVSRIQERTGDSQDAIRTRLMATEDILLDSDVDDFDRM